MFERFTESARLVVRMAQEEARTRFHNYIGTEHLLLALLDSTEGMAVAALKDLGLTYDPVAADVARLVATGEETKKDGRSVQLPFTPRCKKVLELSLREALSLGHNYISTEHILLGLSRDLEGVAARILLDHDIDEARIKKVVMQRLYGAKKDGRVEPRYAPTPVNLQGVHPTYPQSLVQNLASMFQMVGGQVAQPRPDVLDIAELNRIGDLALNHAKVPGLSLALRNAYAQVADAVSSVIQLSEMVDDEMKEAS
jgi:ATP-dependent Clp protease ATP-binding subunit ClpA